MWCFLIPAISASRVIRLRLSWAVISLRLLNAQFLGVDGCVTKTEQTRVIVRRREQAIPINARAVSDLGHTGVVDRAREQAYCCENLAARFARSHVNDWCSRPKQTSKC